MKKLDRFCIYVIACFVALNNAYQMIGTNYDEAYNTWVIVAIVVLACGIINIFLTKK